MPRLVQAAEAVAARRRVYFHVVLGDGITPSTTQAGGQPQVSVDGAAWTDTGVGVLVDVGHGRYFAHLDAGILAAGSVIETRYKFGAAAETPGDSVQVIGFNPALAYIPAALTAAGLDAVVVETGLNARQALAYAAMTPVGVVSGAESYEIMLKGVGVSATRAIIAVDEFGNRLAVTLSPPS